MSENLRNSRRSASKNRSYLQVILVFIAFGVMVLSSYFFKVNTEKNHLEREALVMAEQIDAQISSNLQVMETMLVVASDAIREMLVQGADFDQVGGYIADITAYGIETMESIGFRGVYAMFDIFGEVMFSGNVPDLDWSALTDYNHATRPWYQAAVAAGRETAVTDPYKDLVREEYVITYARGVYDDDGVRLAIVWLPILLDSLREFYDHGHSGQISNDWLLIGGDLTILAHSDAEIVGLKMWEVSGGDLPALTEKLEQGQPIVSQTIVNHLGETRTLTFRPLDNGWYLGVSTLTDNYHRNLNDILLFLTVLGLILASGLSAILVRTLSAKRKADERTEKLLVSMDIVIIITDLESDKILFINEAMKKEFGFDDSVIGKKCWQVLFSGAAGRCDFCPKNYAGKDSDESFTWDFHYPATNKDYKVVSRFIDWPDGSRVLLAQYDDITEMKEFIVRIEESREELRIAREAAEAANTAKSTFLANTSHEIRTPMNSIIGFAELAADDNISGRTKGYLDNISSSANWLLKIINDILDISKIESGKIELENTPFDLHDMFEYCQSVVRANTLEKNITLYCYAEPFIGKKLLGDSVRLRQVLLNLLSNAVKFTNVGVVKILATTEKPDETSIIVHFEVKDSGIGMSPEQVARIFEPFMQGDDSVTRRFGGTGLGLPITKRIIEMMGGALIVESTVGVGSKFSFDLRFETVDIDVDVQEEKRFDELERPVFKGSVLVCEDNILGQQLIIEHLAKVGIQAVLAKNGKEGVDFVKERFKNGEKPFDLILMDVHMPVMDGLEAASIINELGVKTPIAALTANVMTNDVKLYKSNGICDCLGKPFTSQELWDCLAKYVPIEDYVPIDSRRQIADDEELKTRLKTHFVKNNQNTYAEIVKALDAGERKRAHRLAHALKGNAGQIGKTRLQAAALAVEHMISIGNNLRDQGQLRNLETELQLVLDELAPLQAGAEGAGQGAAKIYDVEKIRELLEKLDPLIRNKEVECLSFLDDIHAVPEGGNLAYLLEEYDFELALEALERIKKNLVNMHG